MVRSQGVPFWDLWTVAPLHSYGVMLSFETWWCVRGLHYFCLNLSPSFPGVPFLGETSRWQFGNIQFKMDFCLFLFSSKFIKGWYGNVPKCMSLVRFIIGKPFSGSKIISFEKIETVQGCIWILSFPGIYNQLYFWRTYKKTKYKNQSKRWGCPVDHCDLEEDNHLGNKAVSFLAWTQT